MSAYSQRLPFVAYSILLSKSTIAAFIMRSSACTVNDIFDRKLDAVVERTKKRPLASGAISVLAAFLFLLAQFAIGIAFFSTFKKDAYYINVFQMIPMLCLYPLMKRITHWPQAWLGLAVNVGFVSSWLSVNNVDLYGSQFYTNVYMMGALWCWTMVYDTIYGCQDRKDDVKVGIHSTAVLFGNAVVPVTICFGLIMLGLLYASGVSNSHGPPYFVICIGGTSIFLLWKFMSLDVDSGLSCSSFFIQNAYFLGLVIYLGILADYIRIIA